MYANDPNRGRFNQILHQAAAVAGRRAHRDGAGQLNNRNIPWLQDLRQQLAPRPPVIPGVEPLGGTPMQPVGGFNPPLAPNTHNPLPNIGQAFGNPFGNGTLGHGQIPDLPGQVGPLYGNLQNQNHYNYPIGFGNFGQPPHQNDPNVINNGYMATAQRIHQARDQLEQRRRSQVERRNTLDGTPLQAPNPEILKVRNPQNGGAPWHPPNRNDGVNKEARQAQERVVGARPGTMANPSQNNNSEDNNNNEVFADYLRAHEAFLQPRRAPTLLIINHNQTLYQNATANPPQAAPVSGVRNFTYNLPQHPNRTQEWIANQTAAPPTWRRPSEDQNQGINSSDASASGSGRQNRRPTTPREGNQYGRVYPPRPTRP